MVRDTFSSGRHRVVVEVTSRTVADVLANGLFESVKDRAPLPDALGRTDTVTS
jgi:hypothetical protein